MTTYSNIKSYLAWGKETTYGTAASSIDQWELWETVTASTDVNVIQSRGLSSRYVVFLNQGAYSGSWSGTYKLQDLKLLTTLGAFSDSISGSGPYTHTITPTDSVNSATVELGHDSTSDIIYKMLGAAANNFSIPITMDKEVNVSTSGVFKELDDSDTSAQTPALKTTQPFVIGQIETSVNGTTVDETQDITLNLATKISENRGLNSQKLKGIKVGTLDVTASLTVNMDSTRYYELLDNDTEFAVSVTLTENANRSIEMHLPNCKLSTWTDAADVGGDIVNVKFDVVSRYDASETGNNVHPIYFVDTNSISTAY